MGAAEAEFVQRHVGGVGEVAIGEEQQVLRHAHVGLGWVDLRFGHGRHSSGRDGNYVSVIDLSVRALYGSAGLTKQYCGECRHGAGSFRRSGRLDLVGRRPGALARREAACADAWAALCQRRVRRRTGVCRQHLPAARPHRPADQLGAHPGVRDPVLGRADRRRLQRGAGGERPDRRLCAPDRLARLGDAGGVGAAHEDPPGDRRLAVAELFRRRPDGGHPAGHGGVEAALAGDRADRVEGDRALHDRHAVEAPGGGSRATPMR